VSIRKSYLIADLLETGNGTSVRGPQDIVFELDGVNCVRSARKVPAGLLEGLAQLQTQAGMNSTVFG